MNAAALSSAHQTFLSQLPTIDKALSYHFRHQPARQRDDVIADARAAVWHAWLGLLRRGKDPLAVGVTAIARNAARYVKAGRLLGCGTGTRGCRDVFHHRAQKAGGFQLLGLDDRGGRGGNRARDAWRAWEVEDNRVSPADQACFELDYEAWLARLPERKRRIAELLAAGETTGDVARQLGVTAGAVSQTRRWLEADWRSFQGESTGPAASPLRKPAAVESGVATRCIRVVRGERAGAAARSDTEGDRTLGLDDRRRRNRRRGFPSSLVSPPVTAGAVTGRPRFFRPGRAAPRWCPT